MSDFKPAKPATFDQFQQPARSRSGFGCFGIGCLGVIIVMVLLCVGSYYTMMHSSFPLSMIESAIESEGDARVEGLRGSISSGFEMDRLEFASDDPDRWNELRDVKFRFNGIVDVFVRQRLIIEEASIGGATIYAPIDQPEAKDDAPEIDWAHVGMVDDEVSEELEELRDEMSEGDMRELAELRIDLVGVRDFELVDPETDARLKFDRVEFRNFLLVRGEIQGPGEIFVDSDQLDLETIRSTEWPDEPLSWRFEGVAKPALSSFVIAEVPFVLDTALTRENGDPQGSGSLAGDAVRVTGLYRDETTWTLADFSPGEYFRLGSRLVPQRWNGTFVTRNGAAGEDLAEQPDEPADDEEKESGSGQPARWLEVKAGASFLLHETQFEMDAQTRRFNRDGSAESLVATGKLGEETVTARLTLQKQRPYVRIALEGTDSAVNDVWAQLFFGNAWDQLDAAQQREIQMAIAGVADRDMPRDDEPAEAEAPPAENPAPPAEDPAGQPPSEEGN